MCQKWWWCSTWFGPRSWMVCPLKSPLGIDQDLWVSWIFPHGFFHTWMNHLQLPLSCEQKGPIGPILLLHCTNLASLRRGMLAKASSPQISTSPLICGWAIWDACWVWAEGSGAMKLTILCLENWRSPIGGSITRHCYLYDRMAKHLSTMTTRWCLSSLVQSVSYSTD